MNTFFFGIMFLESNCHRSLVFFSTFTSNKLGCQESPDCSPFALGAAEFVASRYTGEAERWRDGDEEWDKLPER